MTAEERKAYFAEQAREIEAAKAELAAEHDLDRNEKFELAFRIAWDRGHSSGMDDVKNCFHDLVPLLQ